MRALAIHHRQLSFDVIGCAQKVHRALGPGFPENVYHKALCYELVSARIPFESEKATEVFYEGKRCGEFRADLVVDGKIIVELKALDKLIDNHVSQAISYLKASSLARYSDQLRKTKPGNAESRPIVPRDALFSNS